MSFHCDLLDAAVSEEVESAAPAELSTRHSPLCRNSKRAIKAFCVNGRCGLERAEYELLFGTALSGSRSIQSAGGQHAGTPLE